MKAHYVIGHSEEKKKLLLIDDEPDIVYVMKRGLELHGFQIDAFNDPGKALEHFKPNYYHRIITDIRMPGMNGFELARKIWASDSNAQVCFSSCFEIQENEAKKVMPNLKTYCLIKKPVTPALVAKHIETHAVSR
jgi:response regulator RpfG family c-di-GMP phosphodiesterase